MARLLKSTGHVHSYESVHHSQRVRLFDTFEYACWQWHSYPFRGNAYSSWRGEKDASTRCSSEETYVDGLMNGEAFRSEEFRIEDVTIVS